MRLSRQTPIGQAFAERLGGPLVPFFAVYNGEGEERLRFSGGLPKRQVLLDALNQA